MDNFRKPAVSTVKQLLVTGDGTVYKIVVVTKTSLDPDHSLDCTRLHVELVGSFNSTMRLRYFKVSGATPLSNFQNTVVKTLAFPSA